MGQKLNCDITRDLLPNYVEKLTSEETNESIREHLKECPACMDVYFAMAENIDGMRGDHVPEVKEFKLFLKYTKLQILSSILYGTGILGMLTCFIVNIAIEKRLTWSLLAAGGIALMLLPLFVGRSMKRRRIESAYFCMIVFLLPYLKLIEVISNRYFLSRPVMWFWSIALPISILWCAVIALGYLFGKRVRKNLWFLLSGLLALCLPASVLTQLHIIRYYPRNIDWIDIMINGISMAAGIFTFLIIGFMVEYKKKNSLRES